MILSFKPIISNYETISILIKTNQSLSPIFSKSHTPNGNLKIIVIIIGLLCYCLCGKQMLAALDQPPCDASGSSVLYGSSQNTDTHIIRSHTLHNGTVSAISPRAEHLRRGKLLPLLGHYSLHPDSSLANCTASGACLPVTAR